MSLAEKATAKDFEEIKAFQKKIFDIEEDDLINPKMFVGRNERMEHFWVVREEGKIVAAVCSLPQILYMNGYTLKSRAIGYVAVDESCRGKGYMKLLMNKAIEEAKADGTHIMTLAGQRQRYQYFGFGHNNAYVSLRVTPINVRHLKPGSATEVSLMPVDESSLAFCQDIYENRPVRFERPDEDFIDTLKTWQSDALVISYDGKPVGYASVNGRYDCVQELCLLPGVDPVPAALKIVEKENKPLDFLAQCFEKELFTGLSKVSENASLTSDTMIRVLNWKTFLEAALSAERELRSLPDTDLVIQEAGCKAISVKVADGGERIVVTETDEPSAEVLESYELVHKMFNPFAQENGCFPLHLALTRADRI